MPGELPPLPLGPRRQPMNGMMPMSSSKTWAAAPMCLSETITQISSTMRPGGAKALTRSTRASASSESPNSSSTPLSVTSATPLGPALAVQSKKMTYLTTSWTTWRRRRVWKRLSLSPPRTTPSDLSRPLQARAPVVSNAYSQPNLK